LLGPTLWLGCRLCNGRLRCFRCRDGARGIAAGGTLTGAVARSCSLLSTLRLAIPVALLATARAASTAPTALTASLFALTLWLTRLAAGSRLGWGSRCALRRRDVRGRWGCGLSGRRRL